MSKYRYHVVDALSHKPGWVCWCLAFLALTMLAACANPASVPQAVVPPALPETLPSPAVTSAQVSASPTPASQGETSTGLEVTSNQPTPTSISTLPAQADQPTDAPAFAPDDWMSLPVVPTVSETARQIYARGLELGRDPHAFSKIGDCQSINTYFLAYFDMPRLYRLGDYDDLQQTIDWFPGSFERTSQAVKGGFNAAAILSPLRANPKECAKGENPVVCEIRLHNPSIVLISLEEWWAGKPEKYEGYLRQILDYVISQGVVPIVATKADNLEGDHLINQTIAKLASEYDIPLWNFWLAVQPLPNHGLVQKTSSGDSDLFHLTHSKNHYDFEHPAAMRSGWAMRNLTALQALDAVRRGLAGN